MLLVLLALAQPPVAPTDPKSPADELASFKLPPGFRAELVAAEPDIGKPIQMAFDHRGRLWVTTSRHYPFAAAGQPSDKLYVLSDFAPDGRARRVETFAADLNIPIGVLPLPDGKSCLVSEVGRVVKLTDTDGDGKADAREVVLSGFGSKDTHGMTNSFVLKPDGWVYACHGFANDSTVVAKDGSRVVMNSGSTYRFRPDGSRVEPWTRGQVNPFGMTLDPGGNLYTADCHSKPITQLIRGAVYQSFAKPHDGLGFAPHVTRHDHGSTGLCGLAWYEADQFPKEWHGCLFLGNVVTNRVNADRIVWKGSTPVAEELPDLLASSDPWFRPTDLKLGPDGALYVSDFYNRVIGHYEVDLKHPGRDKDRGRVWRIVHSGKPLLPVTDVAADPEAGLKSSNLVVRQAAAVRLGRSPASGLEHRQDVRDELEQMAGGPERAKDVLRYDRLVQLIRQCPPEDTHLRFAARIALRNTLPHLLFADFMQWNREQTWPEAKEKREQFLKDFLRPEDVGIIADACLGLPESEAADWLGRKLAAGKLDPARRVEFAVHLGRYGYEFNEHFASKAVAGLPPADGAAVYAGLCRGVQGRGAKVRADTFAVICSAAERALADAPAAGFVLLRDADRVKPADWPPALRTALLAKLNPATPEPLRLQACDAVLQIAPAEWKAVAALIPGGSPAVRERAAVGLAARPDAGCAAAAADYLKDAPARQAALVATALAGHKPGADALLAAVRAGKASARLLQDKKVAERLPAAEVAALTKDLPPLEARLAALVRDRAKLPPGDPAKGKAVFTQHCANCHQLGGEGAKVGPQLDGVGHRGAERLCEDILDPSRNVDAAFRSRVVTLTDGRTVSGAFLRDDGAVLVLADQQGKEVRLAKADIEAVKESPLSPMPANFDTLPADDFRNLLAYLLK